MILLALYHIWVRSQVAKAWDCNSLIVGSNPIGPSMPTRESLHVALMFSLISQFLKWGIQQLFLQVGLREAFYL